MQTQLNRAVTVTIPNPTTAQMIMISELMEAGDQNETAQKAPKKGKRTAPAKTVSDDEDEDFGKKAMSEDDLDEETAEDDAEDEGATKSRTLRNKKRKASAMDEEDAEEDSDTETDSEDDETDTDSDEDESPKVTFQELKAAMNKYGEKHPDQMRAILSGFNIKGPKELAARTNEKYWDPVFRKVMSKLSAMKKKAKK
jgi:hypothetical protein